MVYISLLSIFHTRSYSAAKSSGIPQDTIITTRPISFRLYEVCCFISSYHEKEHVFIHASLKKKKRRQNEICSMFRRKQKQTFLGALKLLFIYSSGRRGQYGNCGSRLHETKMPGRPEILPKPHAHTFKPPIKFLQIMTDRIDWGSTGYTTVMLLNSEI